MREVTFLLSASLLLAGALSAQEHSHPTAAPAPRPANAAETPRASAPEVDRLDASDKLFDSIRSGVEAGDASAVRSSADAYVTNLSGLREEIARPARPEEPGRRNLVVVGKRLASQATGLEALAGNAPRKLRKDVQRAVAAADALLGVIAKGRSPEERIQPERRDPPSHHGSGSSHQH